MPHTLPAQFVSFDESLAESTPETFVMLVIHGVEGVKIRDTSGRQIKYPVDLAHRLPGIRVEIPKRMIQIEEQMLIHDKTKKAPEGANNNTGKNAADTLKASAAFLYTRITTSYGSKSCRR